jgi:hypothetical protein
MKKLQMRQMESLQGGALPTIKIKDQTDYSCTEGYLAVAASLAGAPVPYNMVQKGLSCMGSWFN